jgi:serine/threonine protein kinase
LLRLLAEGGQGSVYAAEDRRLGRRVALKLRPLPLDSSSRNAALAEARTLAGFSHHLIVQIHDVVELRDALALVMEYVPGSDLEQLSAVMEFEQGSVVQLALELCSALAVAHANGVVHGDLKPANVLLTEDGHVKLGDFGVAIRSEVGEAEAGSASTMAPEQILHGHSDARSDLFSLGCLMYRLICGEHPYAAGKFLPGTAPTPLADRGRDVHSALEHLVMSLLQEDPARRPGSALQVRQELLAIAREFPAGDAAALVHLPARVGRGPAAPVGIFPGDLQDIDLAQRPRAWSRVWMLSLPVIALAAIYAAGAWLPGERPEVRLGAVSVEGSPRIDDARLAEIVRRVLQARPELLPSVPGGGDTVLSMHVSCNAYVCTSQMTRRGPVMEQSDTRALLPGEPEQVWRRRVEQGVRELFP